MINSILPAWRQIFGKITECEEEYWNEENCIFTSRSAISMKIIFESCREIYGESVNVYVPAYFCQDTLNDAYIQGIQYFYYPINSKMEPDWDKIRTVLKTSKIHLFIFCHYFGMAHDVSRAKNFCLQKGIILIEDCTHVVYPGHRFGKKGDFVLYSPHKTLPVPDGGILIVHKSENNQIHEIQGMVINKHPGIRKDFQVIWRFKKAIQKVIRKQKPVCVDFTPHYGKKDHAADCRMGISSYSRTVLNGYDVKKLKQAEVIRKDNVAVLNYMMQNIDDCIRPQMRGEDLCPYYAVFDLGGVAKKKAVLSELAQKGIYPQYWPDLPADVRGQGYSLEEDFAGNLILIPCHQGIRTQYFAKMAVQDVSPHPCRHIKVRMVENREDRLLWKTVMEQADMANIPQDWQYGSVKAKIENWMVKRYLVFYADKPVGAMQVLVKMKYGISYYMRINRGPLFIPQFDRADIAFETLKQLKKADRVPVPVFWAPNMKHTVENLILATRYGWIQWNPFGFSSGVIALTDSEEKIRKNLNSKWRNQLVRSEKLVCSEKRGLNFKNDSDRFDEIVSIYEMAQKEKGFAGIPSSILHSLRHKKHSPLKLLYMEDEDEIIAFDSFLLYKKFCVISGWMERGAGTEGICE